MSSSLPSHERRPRVMPCKGSQRGKLSGSILAGALVFLAAGTTKAFTYTTGDLVGVFEVSGTELIVNLGSAGGLTNGKSFSFGTPSNFGPGGALGGFFTGFATVGPFTGTSGRNVTFTTDPSINPPSFDNNITKYVTKISQAQVSLDTGTGTSSGAWLPLLPNFPAGGTGGVIFNNPTSLAIPSSETTSYENVIGLTTNQINGKLPFSTAKTLTNSSETLDLWKATQTATTKSSTDLLGTFDVQGNSAGDGSMVKITFSAIPEPSTLLLVSMGLCAIASAARGRDR
jgi:hypothetical protein